MPDWLRRYVRPREGWLSAFLLLVMLLSVAWSVQAAGWLLQADYLLPVAIYGLLLGVVLGLTTLSVVAVLPISAVIGAMIVLSAVGGEYFPNMGLGGQLSALHLEAVDWILILTARGYAPQLTPYAVGLGVIMWVTAFIAGYTLYRHHRVMDAILLVGAALITNMASTLIDLFGYLVLFMVAALLLWLRAALLTREEGWQRRRVNENADVPAAIMWRGAGFIAASIVLAWALTGVAVAAPLTAVWQNLDTAWSDVRSQLDLVLGGLNSGESRFHGTNFGPNFSISGEWSSRDDPVLTVAADRALYLRAVTYDVYTGRGWAQTPGRQRDVPIDQPIFPQYSPERPTLEATDVATIEIQIQRSSARTLFTTGYPISASAPTVVTESANQPFLGQLTATTSIPSGSSYGLKVAISTATEAQLRSAGTDYPAEITQYYLGTDNVTVRTRQLAEEIVADADTPYDMAEAFTQYLQGVDFEYRTTAPVATDPNQDAVDFFLFDEEGGRVGFCEHYASAMVAMARSVGIPARMAIGFAPGERAALTGGERAPGSSPVWQVREKNAHAWPELYFPGFGWQVFEATKSIRPVFRRAGATANPDGQGGTVTPPDVNIDRRTGPEFSLPSAEPIPGGRRSNEPASPSGDEGRGGALVIIVVLGLLGLAAWRWRRARLALRFLSPGDRQWMRLSLAAERAGVGQRPSETIYEYAGWLEEQIPARRVDIKTLADGKVLQTYSGRRISGNAIRAMEAAWKRLQLPMIWLAVRRRLGSLIKDRRG